MKNKILALALFVLSITGSYAASPALDLNVVRVTPNGENVPLGNQIVFEFNREVVPVGKMERDAKDIPIKIEPALNCNWLWINTRTLACNLSDGEMKLSTKYNITVDAGIKSEDGAVNAKYESNFTTELPQISYTSLQKWYAPGVPEYSLNFNQPVTKESVEQHIYMHLTNSEKKYPVSARRNPDYESEYVWLIRPIEELPIASNITITAEAGLKSVSGNTASNEVSDFYNFRTHNEFKFLGVKCTNNEGDPILVATGKKQTPKELCDPLNSISLSFSAPVLASQIRDNIKVTPDLAGGRKDYDPWADVSDYSKLGWNINENSTFDISLPEMKKADKTYNIESKDNDLNIFERIWNWILSLFSDDSEGKVLDEFGRALDNSIDIKFKTDNRKPNFVSPNNISVLEKNSDSEVPFYVNNLNEVTFNYSTTNKEGQTYTQKIPAVKNVQFAIPFGVRKILDNKSGVLYGTISTNPVVMDKVESRESRLFAQVTPFQLHAKIGHFSSIVWATNLATGAPVEGVKITAYKNSLAGISTPAQALAVATTDKNGIAKLPGTEKLDPELELQYVYDDVDTSLMIRADKGDDIAILPLRGDFELDTGGISSYDVYSDTKQKYRHIVSWGTTAQGIYKAGDTIQYKIYVRNKNDFGLTQPPAEIKYKLRIKNPEDNTVEEKEILLDEFGSYSGEYKVAESAPVGWYNFRLNVNESEEDYYDLEPVRVLVSDFTPAPFKVNNELNGKIFEAGQEVEVSTDAKLHSGGAYTDASARVTAMLDVGYFTSDNPKAKDFYFNSSNPDDPSDSTQIFQKIENLNEKGELSTKFKLEDQQAVYGKLVIESAVQDDRGKYIADFANAKYFGVDRLVGLKSTKWIYESGKKAEINYIVVDKNGNPVNDTNVKIRIEFEETKAARVKGAGNAYITNMTPDWVEITGCEGKPENDAKTCEFTPSKAGNYRAIAEINDTKGKAHATQLGMWVSGSDYVLWNQDNEYYLPITPDKKEYHVGDVAKFLVKNPYPNSYALITVERYGVIDTIVKKLADNTPVIELPIKPDYLPGFYLSVTVMSPRVDKPLEFGQVDLGKPTFRAGYVQVPVKDKYKEITVTAKTDRQEYKPRETVKLSLSSTKKDSDEPVQYAVAVLDESVLDLVAGGTNYYDPYKGFMNFDNLDLRNFSLMMKLVGRQKFEKKGANPGGDGGSDLGMRDFFKFVSYWNPDIRADKDGNAEVSFDLPDNLTGWRVLAVAVTPTDRMGLGQANFKVNKPTEIRPVMPNQVGEGDKFKAGFSVMNRTDKKRSLEVSIEAVGDIENRAATYKELVELEPFKRKTIYLPLNTTSVKLSRDVQKGKISFVAIAKDEIDSDILKHSLPILKQRELVTGANYATITANTVTESLEIPKEIYPDSGSVSVTFSPSVISNLDGAFSYMRDYPYICWEQQLTKAVMASHYKNLKQYMTVKWETGDLTQSTLDNAANYQTPSGGMAYFLADDRYADPYLSAYTALSFAWLEKAGYKIPQDVQEKLDGYLDNLLKTDTVPSYYSDGMASTVRAVALAALSERGKLTKEDLERYKPFVDKMSLFGKAHYLDAAINTGNDAALTKFVADKIMNHANETGGKFVFNETLSDEFKHILVSPMRDNCAVLDSLVKYGEVGGKELIKDAPFKLVRSISASRGSRDFWENTQENMFCMNAFVDYAKAYEAEVPQAVVTSYFNEESFGKAEFNGYQDPQVVNEKNIDESIIGKKATLRIDKDGPGRVYYTTRVTYAPLEKRTKPFNGGIDIRKEISVERDGKWVLLTSPAKIKKGELVRSDIYVTIPAARNFVVVNDPIAGGLEPLNREIANTSIVDANKGAFDEAGGSWYFKFNDWIGYNTSFWSFYRQEIRHDSVRFYSDYLPPGNYHLSYVAQAIAEGNYSTMPVHAEEMYDPDVYGKGTASELVVE